MRRVFTVMAVVGASCLGSVGSLDGGQPLDAGVPRADSGVDAGRDSDSGTADAGVSDAGISDAGLSDAGALNLENVEFFGQHFHRLVVNGTPGPTIFPAKVGARKVVSIARTWDSSTALWSHLEPTRGAFDWKNLDLFVDTVRDAGADVLHTLNPGTPAWASARPTEPFVYGAGGAAEPANLADYVAFLEALFRRYQGRIRYYEVWNEPSFEGTAGLFFTGTPAKLFELQQVTFNTLRSIDPSAQLIGPAFVGDPGGSAATYLQVTQGAYATYADVFGYHFYSGTPERIVDLVRRLREVQQPYGLDTLPLFNTEGGWASRESFPSDPNAVDQALVPGLVARSYIWAKFMGAQRSFYYSYDGYSGLFSAPDSGVPTPAGVAQSQIAKWLEGATFGACFFAGHGTFVCELTRHSLGVGRLVWSTVTSEVVVLPLPAEWGAVETELLDGRKQSLGGAQAIVITGEPQLIKSTTTDWDYAPTAPVSPAASADASCVPPTEYAAVITAEGPLAYYRFGATDGGIAVDSTDHHRDGVITGAPSALSLAPGPLAFADNGGFDFDSAITGQANAVVAPATVNPWAHDFTVEFWANVHDFSGYQMAVVQEQYLTRGFRLAPQSTFSGKSGRWVWWSAESGGTSTVTSLVPLKSNEWHQVVVTFVESTHTLSLYVDGALETATSGATFVPPVGGFQLGRGAGYSFKGALDEVSVYDRALDDAAVKRHHEAGSHQCGFRPLSR